MSRKHYDGRFVTEREHDNDMNWAEQNFINLDKKVNRNSSDISNIVKQTNSNTHSIKKLQRASFIQLLLLACVGYVVGKHDKMLEEHKRSIDRMESCLRYHREREGENNER